MYSSLDRIDIVTQTPDGEEQYIQTDHRSVEEIEADRELSVVFAIIRVLNPKRGVKEEKLASTVVYGVLEGEPPEFLRRAIRAAGGLIRVGKGTEPEPDTGERPPLAEVIAAAFADLGQVVAAEFGVEFTENGVKTVEQSLSETVADQEEDEINYWSAVVKLGAFAGEVLRMLHGGHWEFVETGTLPFGLVATYKGRTATVDTLGKAIKLFRNGPEDSVAALIRMVFQAS